MKTYQRRKIQIATLALVLVFIISTVCGCFAQPVQEVTSPMSVKVTDITDKVNSLSNEFALTSDEVSAFGADDSCWVIVRFKDESILDRAMRLDSNDVYSYINSEAALNQAASINKAHDKFAKKYASIIEDVSFRYNALFNGMAMQIRYGDIKKLEKDSSVLDVIVCERYYVPEAVTQNQVNVYSTGIYDPGDVGYDGTGTVVAVLDTGLDYTHTAFAEQPTGTLAVNLDKVRGLLSSFSATKMSAAAGKELTADELYVSDKVPFAFDYADIDPDVYPTEDHGTHVAGIIAGHDDTITGIATNAQLAIMKVFPNVNDSGASTDGILAALNDCVVLGVDAINMSLGSSCGFSRESDDEAVNRIYDKIRETGICLICAASNDYASSYQSENGDMSLATNPDYGTLGSPSSYEAAMSVASISGVKTKYLMVNGEMEVYFTEAGNTGSQKRDFAAEMLALRGGTSAEFEYVVVPGLGSESNYYDIDVKGKIAVIKRGSLNFEEKITTAQNKGALGAIIYNNVSGVISMSVGKAKIPACSVSMDAGKYFESHTTGKLVIDESYAAGPFMSEFSSWGPLPNLEFKPDITAHGGDILSAVRGGYDHFSGTSMAAPNMAGATILVRQYVKERFPEMSAYDVTELTYQLLMSTATIAYNEEGNPYSPRKQGAGLADIGKSVSTSSYLYVDGTNKPKISLGDDPDRTGVYTMTFKVRNLGATAQSYKLNPIVMTESMSSDNKTVAQKAYMLNDTTYSVTVNGKDASLSGKDSLILGGYATAEVTVTLTLSGDAKQYLDSTFANGMYVEGYIQLLSQSQDVDLNIGFLGFYGDWSVAPMLDVTAYEVGEEQEDPSILEDDKLKADVYATLPMSGFRYLVSSDTYEESFYGMGQFGYKIADGYTEPAIIEDKASLTVNMEGSYSLKMIAAGLLRNAKTVHWQIHDAVTGELVDQGEYYDARKSYFSGARRPGGIMIDFYINELNLANNSRYTFSMECELDWKSTANNLKNTFSFDFYVDNEAPVVVEDRTQVRVEGTGSHKRYFLDLYAYDNHYIQGYQLGTYKSVAADGSMTERKSFHNAVIPMMDGKRNAENRITYDITQYWEEIWKNDGNIYIELLDYAKNRSAFQLQIPSSNAEEIKFSSTMRAVNTRVNEVVDLKDYLVTIPNNLWVKDLLWDTDDHDVAIVRDGVVLGISAGETTLRVSNKDGSKEATLPVNVRDARYQEINLSQIQLNKSSNTIERGEEFTLTASLVPHDLFEGRVSAAFADVNLVWSTSGGVVKLIDPTTGELVDRVEGVREVKVKSLRTGSATVNVIDSKSPSRVNTSCSILIKNEFEVDGVYLKSYTGRGDAEGKVEIPDDLGIVYIYPYAFMNNPYITEIIVPDGVTQIMEAAIYGCENLRYVELPKSCKVLEKWALAWNPNLEKIDLGGVNTIGEMAFIKDEKLSDIDFSGVYSVGPRSFMYCDSLGELDVTSIKSMGQMAFAMCQGITEIITGQFTPIGDYGFYGCTGLTEIELNGGAIGQFAFAECTNLQTVTLNNTVDTIGYAAFYDCESLTDVFYRKTVRVISDFAFANCAFETVVIPDGLEYLGSMAYSFDSILTARYGGASNLIISAGAKLTDLGINAFYLCSNLKTITVEEGNAYLTSSNNVLYDKAMRKVVLVPYGTTSAELTLPSSVTEIGAYSFSASGVRTVVGMNVTKIDEYAFYNASVQKVEFGDVTYIGDYAFYGAESITSWPSCFNSVTYIGDGAFAIGQSSTVLNTFGLSGTLRLPETLTHLGERAFANTKINTVVLSSNLKELGDLTFANCKNLQFVTLNEGLEKIGQFAFAYCPQIRTISMPNSVKEVGYGAFGYCTSLTTVTLSENLTAIADYMFVNCTALKSIHLPEKITVIGEGAFCAIDSTGTTYANATIATINLENVVKVGDVAFMKSKLTSLDAPALKELGIRAFAYSPLTEANVPNATKLGSFAFSNCDKLKSVDVGSAETVGDYAFYLCTALTSLDMPNVKTLGNLALAGASKLADVTFEKLEKIGQGAFAGTAIKELNLPATLKEIALQGLSCYATTSTGTLISSMRIEKITVAENNPLFFTDDEGALYKRLPNGLLTLVYYPIANKDASGEYRTTYTALDKTVRVEAYAFAGNTHLTQITLPERLQVLGAGSFFGCAALQTIELKCAAAPVLEMIYSEIGGGIDNHYYNVFQNVVSSTDSTVQVKYPSNGSGYDAYNWQLFMKDNLFRGSEIVRTQTTIDTADTLTAMDINGLTLDDIAQIVLLRRIYTSLVQEQKNFLSGVIGKLDQAEAQLAKLLSEQIAALPAKVTPADRATVERLRSLYDQCNSQIQGQVSNLDKLTAAEEQLAKMDGTDGGERNNAWMLPTFLSIGGALVIAAAAVLTVLLLKRKKATAATKTTEETTETKSNEEEARDEEK